MTKIVAANWKMHKGPKEAQVFWETFKKSPLAPNTEVLFFPQALALETAARNLVGTPFQFGAQTCHYENQGAFTGELSPSDLKAMGASTVLVGHSERRSLFGETDDIVRKKLVAAWKAELRPLLCIGETAKERESGQTEKVLQRQLTSALGEPTAPLIVAYEPVWAIGTGKTATPEMAEETQALVARILKKLGMGPTPILYGGSVKPENAAELAIQPHISGFLVGGASLDPQSFASIVAKAAAG